MVVRLVPQHEKLVLQKQILNVALYLAPKLKLTALVTRPKNGKFS